MSKALEGLHAGDPGVVKPDMEIETLERMQNEHRPGAFRKQETADEAASVPPARDLWVAGNRIVAADDTVPARDDTMDFIGRIGDLDLYAEFELASVAETWSTSQKSAWCKPFQKVEWIRAWYAKRANRTRMRPVFILAYEGAALRLILPLCIEFSPEGNGLVWLAHAANDYNAPLVDREYLPHIGDEPVGEICSTLCDRFPEIDLIQLAKQPATIAGRRNPFVLPGAVRCASDSHLLDLNGEWEEIYPALRSPKSRRRLREKLAKLRRSGEVRFARAGGVTESNNLIRRAVAWKSKQLDASGACNPFSARDMDPFADSGLEHTLATMTMMAAVLVQPLVEPK